MRLKRITGCCWLLLLLAVPACQARSAKPPGLLTGVHLQATFDIPELIEGAPASHDTMDYLIYLPEGFAEDADQRWPLIFFLHGSGSETYDSAFVMSAGLPEVLYAKEQPEPFPFVVVSPQAYPNVPWWVGDTLPILDALLADVIERFWIDPDRVYVTGLSMGGYGTWYMATAYPERFAAAASVSGSGYRTNYIPEEELFCRMSGVPLWAIHGAQDQISAADASQLFTNFLAQCGGEVKWTLYPDAGHMTTFIRAYRDPELYQWLLSHRRQAGP